MQRPRSFYWYDYETFGNRPSVDWPAQFAGIRTDEDFNEIEPPLEIFCHFPQDRLPQPKACLITGLTPQKVNQKGLCEVDFIRKINDAFSQPGTCVTGYNSLKFDDEVTRFTLYRNFMDPYAREWKNGNSRWDLIDTVRLCAALRPEGMEWPVNEKGVSFKLEDLTEANGIEHKNAHNAVTDVRATIDLAKLIKKNNPALLKFVLGNKDKISAAVLLDLARKRPLIHISSRYSTKQACLAIIIPLAEHPVNKNEIIVYDLAHDPGEWLSLSADEISTRVFENRESLESKGLHRIPLKTVKLNRCPVLAPFSVLRPQDRSRLGIDQKVLEEHYELLVMNKDVAQKLQKVFSYKHKTDTCDPDQMLYSGGFFSHIDKKLIQQVSNTPPEELMQKKWEFQDGRLEQMLFRYRARNWPDILTENEKKTWKAFCYDYLHTPDVLSDTRTNESRLESFYKEIDVLMKNEDTTASQKNILVSLKAYGKEASKFAEE